ncbi:hypothetical protein [Vibrio gallicus]|uniref:hypothetical protein n=1 Tax=Vibrio gallicus TaxID=190897 RepID=UPI002905724D|nr:hypothetical protein [Vibrio gallicus]
MDQDVHEQHQCEIYETMQNALITASDLDLYVVIERSFWAFNTLQQVAHSKSLPRTRSPPILVLL